MAVASPLHYTKCDANPIYGPDRSGAWDSWTNGVSIVPHANGTRYRMYYSGPKGEGIGFAEASVDDPRTWIDHPTSPVLIPREGNWEGGTINQPRVVKVIVKHWRMYYAGWGMTGARTPWAMGLAESFDGGVTWRRAGDQPLLPRGGPGAPDEGGATVPMVLFVNDHWWMWYTAAPSAPGAASTSTSAWPPPTMVFIGPSTVRIRY